MLLMDGDVSPPSLSFARNYGEITYINNKNAETYKVINLMLDEDQWKDQLRTDLTNYYQGDPKFRVCIVSQSSSKVDELYAEIQGQLPHLTVKKLTGKDGGETKKQFLEGINETLEDTSVLFYSRNLGVPARRNVDAPDVLKGKSLGLLSEA